MTDNAAEDFDDGEQSIDEGSNERRVRYFIFSSGFVA